ncbi:MAG: hypothetical protein HOI34_18620 [Rhodospirillaceae bacterium]|jgi:2-hydroxychromene-2-carboxylate isomerase|nr:hypothetical protein [Rhodospirillaceae bacterium]MBT6205690.1 hypothetical protein [Rhodospirillaceae bacterium]MBT6509791.1 hypothetical protein [Rhodospirillaceae bacterium]MBT7612298.1 hypothetical protein [Rhodospirillaceae bacterium]MBT7645576.1 hypothetical protein [Rhodospirillaceae bacterium]
MTEVVDFFYGPGRRYSYLASIQIARIERDTGASFRWLPFQSSRLITHDGRDPFAGEPLSGQYDWDFRRRDAEAWAAFYGVAFRDPIGRLKYDYSDVALAALVAGRQDAVVSMSHRLFRLIFVDDRLVLARDDVLAEARAAGLDMVQFEADLYDDKRVEEHEAIVEEAARRGAFGVPTFCVGEHMFWGNDRLPLLEAALRGTI